MPIKQNQPDADYAAQVMYSRMISDFWDAQVGARYRVDQHQVTDKTVRRCCGFAWSGTVFF